MKDKERTTEKELSDLLNKSVDQIRAVDKSLADMRTELADLLERSWEGQGGPMRHPGLGGSPFQHGGFGELYAPTLSPFDVGVPRLRGPVGPQGALSPSMQGQGGLAPPHAEGPGKDRSGPQRMRIQPPLAVHESDEAYEVEIELPGVAKEDLEVELDDGAVTVTGRTEGRERDGRLLVSERIPREFHRVVPLPGPITPGKSKAVLKGGVLTLRLVKQEPAKPPKKLTIEEA